MKLSIDLNADLGEGAGHDEELLALVVVERLRGGELAEREIGHELHHVHQREEDDGGAG